MFFVLTELIYNFAISFITEKHRVDDYYIDSCKILKDYGKGSYRIETNKYTNTSLDSFACDYYTSMTELSTNNGKMHKFMHYNGGGQAYSYLYYDATINPILPSLFGTKYIFSKDKIDIKSYKKIDSFKANNFITDYKSKNIKIYENVDVLNIGFVIDNDFDKAYKKMRGTAFDNLNDLFKSMTGLDKDVMIQIDREKIGDLEYKYHIDKDTDYLSFSANYEETVNNSYYSPLYINDEFIVSLENFTIGMYKIKNKYYNQDIILSLDDDYLINYFNLYYFDEDVFKEGIYILKEHQLENIKINGNKLSGDISLDKDSTLFLSIPYDKGWNVYIDGKKTTYRSIADTFIGIEVLKGKHKITMKFYPRGIVLGMIVSVLSIICIIILQRKEVYSDKKVKEKIANKKALIYFLSFIIPVIILVGYVLYNQIMTDRDFFMNGENFLTADMGGQYNALYNYIRNVFLGKDSIFYSFHNSLGGNMASTVGYYLASPFNFLYIFVSKSNIPLMTYIIYVLKISLCSLFMNIYIGHKFGNRYSNLIFSLTYAFMGFVVVYFFNNMWLDVIYMTPLVIMGIDKLIDGKPLMYIVTLTLSIIFNFYIAYMLCIFCIIYFIYELFIRYSIKDFKNYKKIILRFIISSLLAGGLSAFFLIPVLLDLRNSMRASIDKSELIFSFNNFPNRLLNTVFSKTLIAGNNRTSMLGRLRPVIYISLFSLVLSYLYFFNKKIKLKEKILSLIIIIFFIMSFMVPYLQLFWQGFSFPNGYIDRYSFLFCFFLILIAAKCFYNRSYIKIMWFILYLVIYSFLTFKLYYLKLPFLDKSDYIITLVLILTYLILGFIYFNVKIKNLKDIIFLIFIIVITELTYNYSQSIILIHNSSYGKYYSTACKEYNNIENEFYRIDGSYLASLIDSFACDTYSLTTALSTSNSDLYKFYYNHGGSETTIGLYSDFNSLPILNSLLGIKYINHIDKIEGLDYKYLKKIKSDNFFGLGDYAYIYRNDDALSLGYIIDENFEKNYKIISEVGLDNLNSLFKSMIGENKNILTKINKQSMDEENLYKFYIDRSDAYLYLALDYDIALNFGTRYQIFINNNYIDSFNDAYLGSSKIKNKYYNQNIEVRLVNASSSKINDFDLYYFDINLYKELISKLKENQLKNVVVNNNSISAEIKLDKDGVLFLSIPYDEGWSIYVDGKKTSYRKIANAFIGLDLKEGKHKISMKFYSKGLILGPVNSIISLLLLIIYNSYLHKVYKNIKK